MRYAEDAATAVVGGRGLLNRTINALPFELHIPGYQFCGPGTRLAERLARGDRGVNPLDAACREHDIAYSRSGDLANRHAADRALGARAYERIRAGDSTLGERAAASAVWAAMKAKTKLGMGMIAARRGTKKKKSYGGAKRKRRTTATRKRTLPVAKRGGFLPLLPALGALGSLIGGAAGVAKAISSGKATRRQLEELQRHNRAMEGRGLYLAPYKRGGRIAGRSGRTVKRKKKKIARPRALDDIATPIGVTTNEQLNRAAARARVRHFRGVFMRDALPARVRRDESGIVNLDDASGPGTHWVAYAKRGKDAIYFDAFGNLRPPRELERYLGPDTRISYNRDSQQTYDQSVCGQLCLRFLRRIDWGGKGEKPFGLRR